MLNNIEEFNRLFHQIIKAAVSQIPTSWEGGIFTIHKKASSLECVLMDNRGLRTLAVGSQLTQLSTEFAHFKRSDNWNNDWLSVTIRFRVVNERGDFNATREFKYAEQTAFDREQTVLPDEFFWRAKTVNYAWQQSPSLLVMEFIMDYSRLRQSMLDQHGSWQVDWNLILNKFCRPNKPMSLGPNPFISDHDVAYEYVQSIVSFNGNCSAVSTLFHDQEKDIKYFFNYELIWDENRWFLVDIKLTFEA